MSNLILLLIILLLIKYRILVDSNPYLFQLKFVCYKVFDKINRSI